jgi:hypothetical protein
MCNLQERRPIYLLVGKPIPVTRIEKPTDEDIDKLHRVYTEALVQMFENFNAKTGEQRQLVIT